MTLPLVAMDNFNVDVTAYKSDILKYTLELALAHHSLVEAYSELPASFFKGIPTLILHWSYQENHTPQQFKFPYKFRIEQLLPFINGWLENADYEEKPDLDGSCSKGWRLFTNMPYNILSTWQERISFCVQPIWAEHHK